MKKSTNTKKRQAAIRQAAEKRCAESGQKWYGWTDQYVGRKGAFQELLKATELLIYNQIAPRWQAFLNEENKDDAQAQQNLKKVMDWYGGKENMMESVTNPIGAEAVQAYQKRLDSVVKKLAGKKGMPVTSFEVKELIGEYGFVIKQMFRLRDESKLMRETAEEYRVNAQMKEIFDRQYGEGMALFFADAVKKFFRDFLESVEIYPEKLDNGFIMKQGRKKENGD